MSDHAPFSRSDVALAKTTLRRLCEFMDLNLTADVIAVEALCHMIRDIRAGREPSAPPKKSPEPEIMDWNDPE